MTKEITLTQGKVALVDDDMFEYLNQWKWYYNGKYAVRNTGKHPNQKAVYLHREIMKPENGLVVDHISCDKLDNRRVNLRTCTYSVNSINKGLAKNNKSGYRGVHWQSQKNKWTARITVSKKMHVLGYFDDLVEAAKKYDEAAKKYHGEFARLNF